MASPAPSLSKIGRLAARLRVMRVLAASPKSGWSAPTAWVATPSSCYASGGCSSPSASPSAPPTNIDDPFYFDIHAVIAANERRKFLERSAEGMNRAAREGRYTGGIVPLGYSVSGDRGFRRLVPDDSPMWAGLSAADVVRRIYDHLAHDGWSCVRIATEFNSLGIPTAYRRAGRGVRGKRTRETWHSGHVRNLVHNTVYKGLLQYGRRSSKPNGREIISAPVTALVSEETWNAAIATLKRNRAMPRNSRHTYLLRSVIRCGVCGLAFCGTWARTAPRYRCNGSMVERGPFPGKCIGASIKGDLLETTVWSDVSRFLAEPEDLIDELLADSNDAQTRAVTEAERVTLTAARDAAQDRRKRAIELYTRGKVSEVEFDAIAAEVERELKTLDERLDDLEPEDGDLDDAVSADTLAEIRERLDDDLSEADRQRDRSAARAPDYGAHHSPRPRPQAGPRRHRLPISRE